MKIEINVERTWKLRLLEWLFRQISPKEVCLLVGGQRVYVNLSYVSINYASGAQKAYISL